MKLGRNDPCHCGSGRKYKHCHYEEDRAAEAKALAEAAEARRAEAESAEEAAAAEDDAKDSANRAGKQGNPAIKDRGGSRFMRDSVKDGKAGSGGGGRPTGGASTSRTTRGSQRGG
jgi:membrane protein involved in colicin uptake